MTLRSPLVHTIDIIPGSVVTRKGTATVAVAAQEGGIAVALDGAVIASMPLPIAGLMSDRDGHWVEEQAEAIYAAGHEVLGIHEDVDVVMTLCFMSLPVIPQIKLLDTGLFDVDAFAFMDIEAE